MKVPVAKSVKVNIALLYIALAVTVVLVLLVAGNVKRDRELARHAQVEATVRAQSVHESLMASNRENCKQVNELKLALTAIAESRRDLVAGFDYYEEHPDERAKALAEIDAAVKLLRPNKCAV